MSAIRCLKNIRFHGDFVANVIRVAMTLPASTNYALETAVYVNIILQNDKPLLAIAEHNHSQDQYLIPDFKPKLSDVADVAALQPDREMGPSTIIQQGRKWMGQSIKNIGRWPVE